MLKKFLNECRFILTLETKGPFLIRDGRYKKNRKEESRKPDNIPIRTGNLSDNSEPRRDLIRANCYIPGTSLRGVVRSQSEKIVRSISENDDSPFCCDPFDEQENSPKKSCSKRMEQGSPIPYANACVICKLFGCTAVASRIRVYDGKPKPNGIGEPVDRDGIAIDRIMGSVKSGANFTNLVLEGYTFQTEIIIRNFELWQLGLLAYVLRDFENELMTVGFGKSKGFGRVKGEISDLILTYCKNDDNKLKGIAELCSPSEVEKYGLVELESDEVTLTPLDESEEFSYYNRFTVQNGGPNDETSNTGIAGNSFWIACAKVWNKCFNIGEDNRSKFKTIPELMADE